MNAMILDDDLNFDWREMPDPVRKPDEVLIKVHAGSSQPCRPDAERRLLRFAGRLAAMVRAGSGR